MEEQENTPMVTKADLEAARWEDVISGCSGKQVSAFAEAFLKKALAAETDEGARRACQFLAQICSMRLVDDDKSGNVFHPTVVLAGGRSLAVDDLSSDDLDTLESLLGEVKEADLYARIADILWVRKQDHQAARKAVSAYLASGRILEDLDGWLASADRYARALRLAASLGKGGADSLEEAVTQIERSLDRRGGTESSFLSAKLMELLQGFRYGEPTKLAEYAETAALRAEAEPNTIKARRYWEAAARWHAIANDTAREKAARLHTAETFVHEVDREMARSSPSFLRAATFLRYAIEAFRRVPGGKTRAVQLRDQLEEYQKRGLVELKPLETKFDPSPLIEQAEKHVAGKALLDALFSLATLGGCPNRLKLREEAEELMRVAPLSHLFPLEMLDANGRPIRRRGSIDPSHPEQAEDGIRAEMLQHAALARAVHAQAMIDPARRVILREHHFADSDILPIAQASPFVPPGRERIFTRGLAAGLRGDLLVAGHLLVPQLEHSIRTILRQHGAQTVSLDKEGIQQDRSLNQLLFLAEMTSTFGEDLTFDLQGLLVDEFGANLRNRMAHGLMSDAEAHSANVLYAWWLTLRLCCLPLLTSATRNGAAEEASDLGA